MASSIQEKRFNIGTICGALGKVRTEWFRIGVSLGIPRHVLKQFKRDKDDPLSAVVECCLQGNATESTKPFSWPSIVEALKSDYVGEPGLAEEINEKFCQNSIESEITAEQTQGQSEQLRQREENQGKNDVPYPSPSSSVSKMDPKVVDNKFSFENNLMDILAKYATYVDRVCVAVQDKGVTVGNLRSFLLSLPAYSKASKERQLSLLADGKQDLEKCVTIADIFDILKTDYATFLDYEIFQFIQKRYDISSRQTKLNYIKHFLNKLIISEFPNIKHLLKWKSKKGFKECVLKLDIEMTCKFAKVRDLKEFIAKIMNLNPSALKIVDIQDGSIVVTFLISSSIADVIFTPDTVFTPQQQDKFRAASVLWIKCNGHTFDFEVKSKVVNPAQKKLEDQVTYSVCLGRYTDPKLLQCHHCLQGLVQQDQQGQLTLTCPTCRQVTPVPASGVAGLQADFRVNQLLEIVDEEWKEGATAKIPQAARPEEVPSASSTILTPHEHITVFCPQHDGKATELYCETCEEAICMKCTIKGGKHQGHSCDELETTIQTSLTMCEQAFLIINEAVANVDARCDEISNQQATIEEEIHNTDIVDVRKTELISQLHQLIQAKLKSLAAQRDQRETIQAQLNRHLHFMRETSHHPEAMLRKISAVRRVKELATSELEPNTEADIKFYASISDCITDSQSYGLVIAGSLPFKCQITETPISSHLALLETVDSYNQPLNVSMNSIKCELVSEQTGTRLEARIDRRGQSQYQINYQPTIKGRQQLHIKVEGQPIRGSPFPVSAWSPVVEVVDTPIPILTISGVKGPRGVAVNKKGEVIVSEIYKHCVTVFSPSGKKLRSFGTKGSGLGQFEYPDGVAVDGEENILVADTYNHRIQKFTAQGEFLKAVGTKGTGPLQFKLPRGIAFNTSNGRVYVADWYERIQILSPDLSYLDTFGEKGGGMGQFNDLGHVACDSSGNVYVADKRNCHIQVFTAEGKFLRMFGRRGKGRGELYDPLGMAVDSSDKVYVCEHVNHRVSVFTSEGQFVTLFGSEGFRPGQFIRPAGIAVHSSGVVYVCDYKCVKVF